MNKAYYSQGWTLVELMITVAIIGIVASIAVPTYNDYIRTGSFGTARANAEALAGFEDTYFYENGDYLAGTFDPSSSTDTLSAALEWLPSGDKDLFKYVVTTGGCTAPIKKCYTITVTMINDASVNATISRP